MPSRVCCARSLFWPIALVGLIGSGIPSARAQSVTFPASDGVTIHATWFRSPRPSQGIILAFHQGGASGVGEYGPVAERLTREGFDVLAVDQRSGGSRFGGQNRTVAARQGRSSGFCEVAEDLEGAILFARKEAGSRPLILLGSSYSGALVLRAAAQRPEGVTAVLAFSPASGGPMEACRGEDVSDRIEVPMLALRPRSELDLESARAQFELFRAQGHQVHVADPGTHGASMLVAERVGAPADSTWTVVLAFLKRVLAP